MLAPLPPLVPTASARRAAFAWAAQRAGNVAVAVVDSRGRLYGYHAWRPFITASVVKAMLLVAYLRRHRSVERRHARDAHAHDHRLGQRRGRRRLPAASAATASRASRDRAGMRSFRAGGAWIVCRVAAADMARFFRDMERYMPAGPPPLRQRPARRTSSRTSAGASRRRRSRVGYRVYFKPGWLGAWMLANEAARLERAGSASASPSSPTTTRRPPTARRPSPA